MKLLVDESVDFGVVRALRAADYDVLAVTELNPGISDPEVAARAEAAGRILLTEDKDFGQLVFAAGAATPGVILIRFPAGQRREMIETVVGVIRRFEEKLPGHFVVVQPGKVRFSSAR